ncbi:Uncharacterised protein [Vibrio cholerae]|nr:Uncharacterised protein [Vibrio cholerae]CSB74872.1 Uncharacterised protein [Vibrio cholerae]CSC34289.1 Uncharacterised protein [Vibrio cholerae]
MIAFLTGNRFSPVINREESNTAGLVLTIRCLFCIPLEQRANRNVSRTPLAVRYSII